MEQYDVKCPKCGHKNKDLFLYETEGRYICEECQYEGEIPKFRRPIRVPILTPKQAALLVNK